MKKNNYVEYAGGKNIDNSAKLQVDYSLKHILKKNTYSDYYFFVIKNI